VQNFANSFSINSYLEFSIIGSEKGVKRTVLHELGDDHDRVRLGDNTLKENDVRVFKLTHDWRLRQEVVSSLFWAARFQRFDGHQHVVAVGKTESASTNVAEFTTADDGFDGDVARVDFFGKLFDCDVRVFVGVRVDVGLVRGERVVQRLRQRGVRLNDGQGLTHAAHKVRFHWSVVLKIKINYYLQSKQKLFGELAAAEMQYLIKLQIDLTSHFQWYIWYKETF